MRQTMMSIDIGKPIICSGYTENTWAHIGKERNTDQNAKKAQNPAYTHINIHVKISQPVNKTYTQYNYAFINIELQYNRSYSLKTMLHKHIQKFVQLHTHCLKSKVHCHTFLHSC